MLTILLSWGNISIIYKPGDYLSLISPEQWIRANQGGTFLLNSNIQELTSEIISQDEN